MAADCPARGPTDPSRRSLTAPRTAPCRPPPFL